MAENNNQLDELAKKARSIGLDIGPIISFSLDYMSASDISEFLYTLQDEFYALAEGLDLINEQIHEGKGKSKLGGRERCQKLTMKNMKF